MNEIINTIPIQVYLSNNVPVVTSRNVAEYFHKSHKNVLRNIDNLISEINEVRGQNHQLDCDTKDFGPILDSTPKDFSSILSPTPKDFPSILSATKTDFPSILGSTHFKEISYIASNGKPNREFEMTKDGFTLLAMGFTGKEALKWKLKYIEAFNRMENIIAAGGNSSPGYTAYKEMPAAPQNIHVQAAVRAIQSLIKEGFTIQQTIRGEDFKEPFLGYSDDAGSIYIKPSLLYDRYCSLIPGTALNRGAFYQILDEAGLIRKNNKGWVHNRHGYSPYIHITCKNLKQYPFLRFRHEVLASFGLLPM